MVILSMRAAIPLLLLLLHQCCGREVESAAQPAYSHLNRRLHGTEVHRVYFCSLEGAPITQVMMNETIGKVYEYPTNNNDTSTAPPQTFDVKACACFRGLLNNTSYCPADSNYCHISVAYNNRQMTSRKEGHNTTVECFRDTQLKIFARSVFNYWAILMVAMTTFLIWSGTGRVSFYIYNCVLHYRLVFLHSVSISQSYDQLVHHYSTLYDTCVHVVTQMSMQDMSMKDCEWRLKESVKASISGVTGLSRKEIM